MTIYEYRIRPTWIDGDICYVVESRKNTSTNGWVDVSDPYDDVDGAEKWIKNRIKYLEREYPTDPRVGKIYVYRFDK